LVTVPGYRSRDPEFESRDYQIFSEVVGLERGPLCLVRITEELLEWKSSGSGSRKSMGIRYAHHATPSIFYLLLKTNTANYATGSSSIGE
jgi:hypothetical protein